jgi:hypothetical protein
MDDQSLLEYVDSLSASNRPRHPPIYFYDTRFCCDKPSTLTAVRDPLDTWGNVRTRYQVADGLVVASNIVWTPDDREGDKISGEYIPYRQA